MPLNSAAPDTALVGSVCNKDVYDDFMGWWELYGNEGKPPSTRAVGKAVCKFYHIQSPRRTTRVEIFGTTPKQSTIYRYEGWRLAGTPNL